MCLNYYTVWAYVNYDRAKENKNAKSNSSMHFDEIIYFVLNSRSAKPELSRVRVGRSRSYIFQIKNETIIKLKKAI